MTLAALETKQEEEFLFDQMAKRFPPKHIEWFIGGTNLGAKTDDWYWVSTKKRIDYRLNWAEGEPNLLDTERCIEAGWRNGWIMNNCPCSAEIPFMCEKVVYEGNC